jgi:uracil phosphoribosyltransferase
MTLHVIDHPLAQDKLTRLRNKKTAPSDFRRLVMELAQILVLEATRDVKLKDVEVETPLAKTLGKKLAEPITLAPIMRAGLAMVEGGLQLHRWAILVFIAINLCVAQSNIIFVFRRMLKIPEF